ncbi:DUF262 domain-containing protein [Mucilaginibacter sp. NFX135]|uniref:DUF262 domain-containing protein n=1 Tax=Mucilaginibacter sp. NFX135 TaxID=3402687 RepID=UPI003AFA9FD9
MNSELVFPIGRIFDDRNDDGALARHQAAKFFIAPYQRGYKWGAEVNEPVSVLLKDLKEAFDANSKEYYLQYITTQENTYSGVKVLEVIDGQQRLTTLTLLFTVLANLTGKDEVNFVKHKLLYQVREKVTSFFDCFIYDNIEKLFDYTWQDFISEYPENNEQDIYYLFHALKRMIEFAGEFEGGDVRLFEFASFVRDRVMIILNNVTGNISCEKIFSNLNTNKVELTNVELIKGLFLTKAAREKIGEREPSYKEVVEVRALLGRQWDEIAAWANQTDTKILFFEKGTDPVYQLLLFFGGKYGYKPDDQIKTKYGLFNYFQSLIKADKFSAVYFFKDLKKTQSILNNWFNHDPIYNSLGFLFFSKGSRFRLKDFILFLEQPLAAVEKHLKSLAWELLPGDINELDYDEHDKEIHALLLALSVFFSKDRFSFTAFSDGFWSLEHIFPQTPEDLPDDLQKEDIDLIQSLMIIPLGQKDKLIVKFGKFNLNYYNSLNKKLNKTSCSLSAEEKLLLYQFIRTDKLNRIGNMALLTRGDNSSNSNGMFFKKRHNIVSRVSKGSFVPKHTYDVFSKLISDKMSKDMAVWSDMDIAAHQTWILSKIENLKKTILI